MFITRGKPLISFGMFLIFSTLMLWFRISPGCKAFPGVFPKTLGRILNNIMFITKGKPLISFGMFLIFSTLMLWFRISPGCKTFPGVFPKTLGRILNNIMFITKGKPLIFLWYVFDFLYPHALVQDQPGVQNFSWGVP